MRWFLGGVIRSQRGIEFKALLPYAAAYTILHGLLVAAGFFLSTVPAEAVAIWPAVGMLCAVLAATPRRTWPVWILCAIVGRLVFEVLIIKNRELIAPVSFSLINVAEAVVFALLMQRPVIQSYNQGRPLFLSIAMTIVAALAASFGGLLGATVLSTMNFAVLDFWSAWRIWAAGDFVGMILVTPLAVWLMLPQIRIKRGHTGWLEFLALVAALLVACYASVLLIPEQPSRFSNAETVGLLVLLLSPVLWAAFRAEFWMVAVLQLLLTVVVLVTASNGYGLFAHDTETYLPKLAALQLYLVLATLVVTTLSFVVLERQQARRASSLHQRFSDMIVLMTNQMISAGSTTIDQVISNALTLIGEFSRADHCVLIQVADDRETAAATHAWAAERNAGAPLAAARAKLTSLPWVTAQFREHGYIIFEDFDEPLSAKAAHLEGIRNAIPQAKMALYIGLFADNRLVGAIGYGYLERGALLSGESISLMYLTGQLFANILQRRKTEQDLELYRDKLRSLTKDMAIAEERTRRRAATDLHDGIGQNLAVARMKVGQLLARDGADKAELSQLRNLIDDALRGTRFIISDLSPSILYELGLVPALQSLAERFELANDVACSVEESGESWEPGSDLRIALYRAVQECLNNVARHAQASRVKIFVTWFSDKLDIAVEDDGIGFETVPGAEIRLRGKGFGLFSMQESIVQVGGEMALESAVGLGTTVRLSVPRHEKAHSK